MDHYRKIIVSVRVHLGMFWGNMNRFELGVVLREICIESGGLFVSSQIE